MNDHHFRSSIAIRRLSFVSLLKTFFFAGLAFVAPMIVVGLLMAVFAPQKVVLRDGQTMAGFVGMLVALAVLWPALFSFMFAVAGWIAMSLKGSFSTTSIEIICDDRDPRPGALIEPASSTPTASLVGSIKRRPVIWAGCAVLVAASIAVAGYVALSPRDVPSKVHDWTESPNGRYVASIASTEYPIEGEPLIIQSVRIAKRNDLGDGYATNLNLRPSRLGGTAASIHSCENGDIHVRWTDDTSLVIRYSQTKPDWVGFVPNANGVTVRLENERESPLPPG